MRKQFSWSLQGSKRAITGTLFEKKLTLDLNTAMVEVMKGVEQPFIQEIP